MELELLKKILDRTRYEHMQFVEKCIESERYYDVQNDILYKKRPTDEKKDGDTQKNPMRQSDNRIAHNWYQLLLDQKVAYTLTTPPEMDVDNKDLNNVITDVLGDNYTKYSKRLAVDAGNCGIAWLHVWRNEENEFKYAPVDPKEITPIFSNDLEERLIAVLRTYSQLDEENGEMYQVHEYWTDTEVTAFRAKDSSPQNLEYYDAFRLLDSVNGDSEQTSNIVHGWNKVPFIPFYNTTNKKGDLHKVKRLIDVYDNVYSGFVDDVDDVQEIIFVLTNYGGEDKKQFLEDLKKYKMIKLDSDGADDQSGVDTMAIDIPVEARTKLLEITREQIYTSGQGVDNSKDKLGNNSGVALKFMYSLLELKAAALETEFRSGYSQLVRFVLNYLNLDPKTKIKQTWTRTYIASELEQAQIVLTH